MIITQQMKKKVAEIQFSITVIPTPLQGVTQGKIKVRNSDLVIRRLAGGVGFQTKEISATFFEFTFM